MSMWKNIKSLFIIEEPEQAGKEKKDKPQVEARKGVPARPTSGTASKGKVTEKFTDVLLQAMGNNNIEGFDYLEYKKSLNSLKAMPMDEPTRYKSAFAMAEAVGATPQRITETAQHYIQVLKKEEEKFREAMSKQKKLQIESKDKELKNLGKDIEAKAVQIEKLKKEIEAGRKQQAALKKEIEEATAKVESTKNDFMASYHSLARQIQQDIENMKQFLE